VELSNDQVEAIRHGIRIPALDTSAPLARGISEQGELVALLEIVAESSEWKPRKVFFS
jgi:tRNA pseudouridine55 synthase